MPGLVPGIHADPAPLCPVIGGSLPAWMAAPSAAMTRQGPSDYSTFAARRAGFFSLGAGASGRRAIASAR